MTKSSFPGVFITSTDLEDVWPDPVPLPDNLPDVAQFDFALLPSSLRPWAEDTSELMQCAPDYLGVTIMVGLGSVIGRKLAIRAQAHTAWASIPNLWGMIVGRPGVMKSPAMEAALWPLKQLASKAVESHKTAQADFKRLAKIAQLKHEEDEKAARNALRNDRGADISGFFSDEDEEPPSVRRYISNDSTAAALGELLRQNPNGLLVFRDELVSLLKGLDREDNADARGLYLTGWNGDSAYTLDRIGRGMNLHIPGVCISLLGSTQPGRIAEYVQQAVRGGSGDDGLLQRFGLLIWPDIHSSFRNVDREPNSKAQHEASRVYEYLDSLSPAAVDSQQDQDVNGEPVGTPFLRLEPAALELFVEWRMQLEARLRSGNLHQALESHLAKYRKLVPSLALILHVASGGKGPVSERATLQALAWAQYLETHAIRVYGSESTKDVAVAKAILQRLRKGDLKPEFSCRDVWRPGWSGLSDRAQVARALELLADLDWLSVQQQATPGRTATVYKANPKGLRK